MNATTVYVSPTMARGRSEAEPDGVAVGCQNSIRIWESGEWQTGSAEAGRGPPHAIPGPDEPQSHVELRPGIPFRRPVLRGSAFSDFPWGGRQLGPNWARGGALGFVPSVISDSD
jgi:hypothetical protein